MAACLMKPISYSVARIEDPAVRPYEPVETGLIVKMARKR